MKKVEDLPTSNERVQKGSPGDEVPAPPTLGGHFQRGLEEQVQSLPDGPARPDAPLRAKTVTDADGPDDVMGRGNAAGEGVGEADERRALLSRRVRRTTPAWTSGELIFAHDLETLDDPALSWREWGLLAYLSLFGGYSIPVATLVERSKGEREEVLAALEHLLKRGDIELDPQELSEVEMREAQRRLDEEVAAYRARVGTKQ